MSEVITKEDVLESLYLRCALKDIPTIRIRYTFDGDIRSAEYLPLLPIDEEIKRLKQLLSEN